MKMCVYQRLFKLIFLCKPWSAGVRTYPCHCIVKADNIALAPFKLIVMRLCRKLLLRIAVLLPELHQPVCYFDIHRNILLNFSVA